MKPPSEKPGTPNPYARRTPWGRAQAAPFRLGVGPGAAPLSGKPVPTPIRQPRGGDLPAPGEGILGSSPLMPTAMAGGASPLIQPAGAKATPVHNVRPVPKPFSTPTPAVVSSTPPVRTAPAPPAPPPPEPEAIVEALSRIQEPREPIGRRLLIGGVALGVIALIAAAALMLSRRDEQIDAATSEATVGTPVTSPSGTPVQTPQAASLPEVPAVAPIYRATPPPVATVAPSAPAAGASPAPAAQLIAEPVLPPPAAVDLPPVVKTPAPRPVPPPPAPRPTVDPDAPFVLRRGED